MAIKAKAIISLARINDGDGIENIVAQYYLSNSKEKPEGGEWSEKPPVWQAGKYLWTRNKITYKDGSGALRVEYTDPVFSTEWDAIGQIGTDKYSLNIDSDEILKFKRKDADTGAIKTTLSSEKIRFALQKRTGESDTEKVALTLANIIIKFAYYDSDSMRNATVGIPPEKLGMVVTEEILDIGTEGKAPYKTGFWILDLSKLSQISGFENFLKYDGFFKIGINYQSDEDKVILEGLLPFRYGTSDEMATFQIHAGGFNAAIQSTNLQFANDGLVLKNGAFSIIKDGPDGNPEYLLYASEGDLIISGIIHAKGGTFSGDLNGVNINGVSGHIGGFIIEDNKLVSESGSYQAGAEGQEFIPSIVLNGETGVIDAEKINLGTGAKISNYIKLGSKNRVFLCDPDKYAKKGVFLQVKDDSNNPTIEFLDNGVANFGSIEINGVHSTMRGNGWSIAPEVAKFSNAEIAGTIKTAIFEKGISRTVGGRMIFKDSFYCKNTASETGTLLVEDLTGINYNTLDGITYTTYLLVTNSADLNTTSSVLCQVTGIKEAPKGQYNTITLDKKVSVKADSTVFVILGSGPLTQDPIVFEDWVIGVNSSSSDDSVFGIKKNSITLSSLIAKSNNEGVVSNPEIVIGDLTGVEELHSIITAKGGKLSGLYADSVFLTGMLQTKYKEDGIEKYAGMNTLSQVGFNKKIDEVIGKEDNSNIIFWAGAINQTDAAIQDAKFQVTSDGTLYAQQGIFSGAILTEATIQAKKLVVDSIHGPTNQLPLYIQDADGIALQSEDGKTGFSLTYSSADFMSPINGQSLTLKPIQSDETNKKGSINLDYDSIILSKKNDAFKISVEERGARMGLNFANANQNIFTLFSTEFDHFTNVRYGDSSVFFTEVGEWRPHKTNGQIDGYDFYVN